MNAKAKSKGKWGHRVAIRLFTVLLAVLFYWVLGFFVEDIHSIPGPKIEDVEKRHLDPALLSREDSLTERIQRLERQINDDTAQQGVLESTSRNLQQTIEQLIELRRLGLEKSIPFSESEQASFSESLRLFLENQKKCQELGQNIASVLQQKQELERERTEVGDRLRTQREPALREFDERVTAHRLKLAFLHLAVLLPILLVAGALVLRKRTSIYFPLYAAFATAALIKVGLVVHEYFPTRYFKYIVIGSLLLVVTRILVHFIRTIAFPKAQWLVSQYREAYERFLCPVCEYPIRTGPRRFLFWTRRTVNKIVVPAEGSTQEEPYCCPACGTRLFEDCPECLQVRHSLLPSCTHCGADKPFDPQAATSRG